ncbi:LysR substrate-binding domain-containing protein [Glaciimonas sp. CA11.2]|uniref:LysR family transcriptional regulator n=1 Tax=unclassified Glaciimonas TaxID=2644401 RepID=UPI002AB5342F|nr:MULTISPECIES: LysR substrate-binding domain-containing protein [unclassified Glaciimonas]MDY7549239.1 LysR substrate-binding domain-containing protein [Glaciimonas sp. CA11.2]MEB0013971.1 LysR substrate-binding domain-containing protein [Glaciimonas sp. Cout2]MEB0083175.1 LysR substrate-binding domain-containing protein [Glaciimonas sp. Gout2]MEB0163101.1 LysR substrate-binding domain-containing protein [Glaciimonas sp. CA11.2]
MAGVDSMQLGSIEQFCKAAELGSFTAAAEVFGVTPAAVSRSIGRLEQRLGVRLFSRTTRSVKVTNEGELFWKECQLALGQIAEAERAITGGQTVPSGLLRISVSTAYGTHRLLPLMPKFTEAYPQIEIELSISDRIVDFVEEGFDLAIRVGIQRDSRLVAYKLEDAFLGVFGTPEYLMKKGTPLSLDDLQAHDCIQYVSPNTGRPMSWLFKSKKGGEIDHPIQSRMRILNDALGCVAWLNAGGGLYQTYHFAAAGAVKRGDLVEVLHDLAGRSRPFSILYPQNRHLSAKVRALIDFLRSTLSVQPAQ